MTATVETSYIERIVFKVYMMGTYEAIDEALTDMGLTGIKTMNNMQQMVFYPMEVVEYGEVHQKYYRDRRMELILTTNRQAIEWTIHR